MDRRCDGLLGESPYPRVENLYPNGEALVGRGLHVLLQQLKSVYSIRKLKIIERE
jgi:hypothetical protein